MRILFQTASIPTRAAKRLKARFEIKESEARRVTAFVLGYRNWADLENTIGTAPASQLDEGCDGDVLLARRRYQAERLLSSELDVAGLSAAEVIAQWQPSASRPQVAVTAVTKETPPTGEFRQTLKFLLENPGEDIAMYADAILAEIRHTQDQPVLMLFTQLVTRSAERLSRDKSEIYQKLLEALTEKGEPNATSYLAIFLLASDRNAKEKKRAVDLLESVLNHEGLQKNIRIHATSTLGSIYCSGVCREINIPKGLAYWEEVADSDGHQQTVMFAAFNAGVTHDLGKGVSQNAARAVHFYRIGAKLGCPRCSSNLGHLLIEKPGLTEDLCEAEDCLQFAAEHGDDGAREALEAMAERDEKVQKMIEQNPDLADWLPASAFPELRRQFSEQTRRRLAEGEPWRLDHNPSD